MNAKVITSFLDATQNVLKTMAFIDPRPGKAFLKGDNVARGDVSAIIGMTGSVRGSLALSFSGSCILKIVSNMLGEEMSAITGDVKDAVGEITNMVSGVARQKLEGEGYNIAAAIPTVVSGENHTILHVLAGPSLIIPFETEDGPFVVDICLKEN
jgi:chemotaxis protein CheX